MHQAAATPNQTALERFILDQCSKSIRFAIKACWIFQGFVQDRLGGDQNNPQLLASIRLREFCEIACVNSKRPTYPPHTNKSAIQQEDSNSNNNSGDSNGSGPKDGAGMCLFFRILGDLSLLFRRRNI